ncbi:hypothetical protein RMN57_35835 [Kitasatospora sp. CM 4170]|uniref:Uncharacterized protein n=1 Tax=Kitasatospora aburaviensis TaxID=67265 RepID=A0ABW1EXQ9_9ACTN|nr:hypothetical protein [Kitasatospora sp. CM 4170]WNM49694.1 hypothetical protein RMN57_35835 [Kitasatospora sp. CM 4170]
MHRPSRPEDLDRADRVWARAVAFALLEAATEKPEGYWLDEHGVWCDASAGSYWWRASRAENGNVVFCGQDSDSSCTHVDGRQIDFLAGGPDWLPWEQLREDAEGNLFGFVYWSQDGVWHRIDYPEQLDDDGLQGAAEWLGSEEEFRSEAAALACVRRSDEAAFTDALTRFLRRAEARTVDAAVVAELLTAAGPGDEDRGPLRVEPALDVAVRAGLTGQS